MTSIRVCPPKSRPGPEGWTSPSFPLASPPLPWAYSASVSYTHLCYTAVTLCLYFILKPVNSRIALLFALSGLVGLAFEAVQRHPWGINIAMVFHGLYCLLIGYLILRSTFLPRILGATMAFAGVVWLLYLSPSLAHRLSPWNTACGLLGEALPMLCLLYTSRCV